MVKSNYKLAIVYEDDRIALLTLLACGGATVYLPDFAKNALV